MTLPALDEVLTVADEAAPVGGPYVYSRRRGSSAEGLGWWELNREARSWEELRDAESVRLYLRDDLGRELPPALPPAASTLRLTFPESGQVFEWAVGAYAPPDGDPDWTGQPSRNYGHFTVTAPAETRGGENLPAHDAEARFTLRDATPATSRTLWCARMDFAMRDMLRTDAGGLIEVEHDSRFHVRWASSWKVGRTFTYRGEQWQVRAISEIGRRRGLELLARRSE